MAQYPAMPLWTDAYLGDTTHLTTLEHGAYLLLLIAMWRTPDCSLPNDPEKLRRYARMTRGQWGRIEHVIMEFFYADGAVIRQGKLNDIRKAVRQKSKSARTSANARWLKNNDSHDANAQKPQSVRNANHIHNQKNPPLAPPQGGNGAKPPKQQKGTRFKGHVPDEWLAWAATEFPHVDAAMEADKFTDYWMAKAGAGGVKLDWQRTWRNWIRKAAADAPRKRDRPVRGKKNWFGPY